MIKKNVISLFLLSLFIRLIFFIIVYNQPIKFYSGSDAYNYENIANNLIHNGVFSGETQPPLLPNIYRTPIFPYYIAGVFLLTNNSVYAVVAIQIFIGSIASALMPVLAENLRLSRRIGWATGLFLAFDPLVVFTTYQMITETVFLTLLVSAFAMLTMYLKNKNTYWLIGSAIIFALTSLTRPISQFLPIALVPLFFIFDERPQWRQISRSALLFIVISLFITYSWAFRNYLETGLWSISAIGDYNLLYYRAEEVIVQEEDLPADQVEAGFDEYIQNEAKARELTPAGEIELMRKKAIEIFRQYPVTTAKVHAVGFAKVMVNPGFNLFCIMTATDKLQYNSDGDITSCEAEQAEGIIAQSAAKFAPMNWLGIASSVIEMILLIGVYIGVILGGWKLLVTKKWYLLSFLLIPIAYFSILSAGGESVSRFRIPIIPFLVILAGIGIFRSGINEENLPAR